MAEANAAMREDQQQDGISIRFFYVIWGLLGGLIWSVIAYLSGSLATDPPTTLVERWTAAGPIAALITVTAFLPILLLYSFQKSERQRAQDAAVVEAMANGWDTFAEQIEAWYKRVFDPGRYPVPATLALLTFIAGWTFVLFHDGPLIDDLMATDVGMNALAEQIAEGPPLSYGFLGAYFFSIWFLFKRYISGDLGPGAFLHVSVRTWLVAILTLVVAALLGESAISTTSETSDAVIAAIAFVGAFVPNALLNIIWDVARTGGRWITRAPETEVSLTVLRGMNPWKAARLVEEGIDNVHNLAMDQPSRLFVVTREGGLRILDWVDQAILYNAAPKQIREGLARLGIRTAYELFLALKLHELVHRPRDLYRVDVPPDDLFVGMDRTVLRYVAVNMLHHPSFENVRQMRDQALRTAAAQFPDTRMDMKPVEAAALAATPPMREELDPSVLLVERLGTGPAASAVLIADRLALTTLDVDPRQIAFQAPGSDPVRGTLVRRDPSLHLALYRLGESIGRPARRSGQDPEPGDRLTKHSHVSGARDGIVEQAKALVEVESGQARIAVKDVLRVAIPSTAGEAGSPLFNRNGELAAVMILGNPESTVAVPCSRLPTDAAGGGRRPRVRVVSGTGNGAAIVR